MKKEEKFDHFYQVSRNIEIWLELLSPEELKRVEKWLRNYKLKTLKSVDTKK